jgi:hypothetical protein
VRIVPDAMTQRWYSGEYVGDAKPMVRVTVHRPHIELFRLPVNVFASMMFGAGSNPRELPNVKSVSWNRNVDQDIATCTIEFYNTEPLPLGQVPVNDDLDLPGHYTWSHGKTLFSSRWGHMPNEWANMLMPDNILRTFEGYGFNPDVIPEYDENLIQTGVWMIDDVDINAQGTIVCTCRDVGRLLLDHIAFPPVVPFEAGVYTSEHPEGLYGYPVDFVGTNPDWLIGSVDGDNIDFLRTKYPGVSDEEVYRQRVAQIRENRNLPDDPVSNQVWVDRIMAGTHTLGDARTAITAKGNENANYADYCVDEETEILTRRGWLRWDEVREGDEALAMNPDTGIADWQVIESVYRKYWDARPMIAMESQLHSSLTTPDHRWLVTDQAGRRLWRTTETLKTGHRIPLAAPVTLPEQAKYEDDFVELVAWFWTEGWVSGPHGNACVAQSETVNPIHTARIRACLTRLFGSSGKMMRGRGAMWNETHRQDGVVTFRLSKPVKDALLEVAPNKVVSPEFLTALTASQLELFIERSIDADGWRTTQGRIGISQRDEQMARSFEMALALSGRPFRTRLDYNGMWSINLLRHAVTLPQSATVENVTYSGHVWCPTLKHSNWFARRKGTTYFTGNTDIVKLFLAWGGFYWPREIAFQVGDAPGDVNWMGSAELVRTRVAQIRANRGLNPDPASDAIWVQRIFYAKTHSIGDARNAIDFKASNQGAEEILTDGFKRWWPMSQTYSGSDDKAMTIEIGRVWGDFQQTGTSGVARLPADLFDKKPLMDCIAYVRDIVGFIFHIDELGGAVFKPPNIYSVGNMIRTIGFDTTLSGGVPSSYEDPAYGTRNHSGYFSKNEMVVIDETQILMDVTSHMTSRNIRERTFVATPDGNIGHMTTGWNPNPIGFRRIGGWTDQHFKSNTEARVMADTIAMRQVFTFRTDNIVIPGYPRIQIDDQVRVFERVTSEGYIHYVKGIQSSIDLSSGEYTYNLETHWLGEVPFARWAIDPNQMAAETQEYLQKLFWPGYGDDKET